MLFMGPLGKNFSNRWRHLGRNSSSPPPPGRFSRTQILVPWLPQDIPESGHRGLAMSSFSVF